MRIDDTRSTPGLDLTGAVQQRRDRRRGGDTSRVPPHPQIAAAVEFSRRVGLDPDETPSIRLLVERVLPRGTPSGWPRVRPIGADEPTPPRDVLVFRADDTVVSRVARRDGERRTGTATTGAVWLLGSGVGGIGSRDGRPWTGSGARPAPARV
jgi:DNA/RNA-binding domain of Phe-tRNA-synthetase-like protein